MLRGTGMTLSPFCLSSAAPPAHKGKSPPSRGCFDNPRGMCGWNQARRERCKRVLSLCKWNSECVRAALQHLSCAWLNKSSVIFLNWNPKQATKWEQVAVRSIYCQLPSLPRDSQGQLVLSSPQIISHLDITTALIATARCSQSQSVFKQTAKQTRSSISSFSEYIASRVLLGCGKIRSQEKIIIKQRPLQSPQSAASLSGNQTTARRHPSAAATSLSYIKIQKAISVYYRSEPWVLRGKGTESWVQRICLWIFCPECWELPAECSGAGGRLAETVWDWALLPYKQILFM